GQGPADDRPPRRHARRRADRRRERRRRRRHRHRRPPGARQPRTGPPGPVVLGADQGRHRGPRAGGPRCRQDRRRPGGGAELRAAAGRGPGLGRAVTGVIRPARKPVQDAIVAAETDAAKIAEDRLAFWAPLAEDQERPFEFVAVDARPGGGTDERPAPTTVAVSADELEAALDALLGNVFAHTPEGTAFRVEVRMLSDGGISLAVEDAGPGLSPDFVERGVS